MVIWPELRKEQYRDDDRRENANHLIVPRIVVTLPLNGQIGHTNFVLGSTICRVVLQRKMQFKIKFKYTGQTDHSSVLFVRVHEFQKRDISVRG